jgi:hypothetical protein
MTGVVLDDSVGLLSDNYLHQEREVLAREQGVQGVPLEPWGLSEALQ